MSSAGHRLILLFRGAVPDVFAQRFLAVMEHLSGFRIFNPLNVPVLSSIDEAVVLDEQHLLGRNIASKALDSSFRATGLPRVFDLEPERISRLNRLTD